MDVFASPSVGAVSYGEGAMIFVQTPLRTGVFVVWSHGNRAGEGGANRVAALAMKRGKSVDFTGYWQRHIAT